MTIIETFEIPRVQYLGKDGSLQSNIACAEDKERMLELYKQMMKARLFDKKAIALQRTGRMGTYAPINGQEAISSAIGLAMDKEDVFVPYYRDYAAQFQRGVRMKDILMYWGGDERGSDFSNPNDLPICVPIASQCLHAAGIAFSFQYKDEKRVAVVCIGDGGTSEGDFYEAINVAGAWKLPVVFIVNNNQWAISVPLEKQTACSTIAQKAISAGFKGIQIDGNDVIACYEQISQAIRSAREGNGPVLIEATTYRLCDHTTADDATRYQPKTQVEVAETEEPIARMKHYLESKCWWDQSNEDNLIERISTEIEAAVEDYLATPAPSIASMFDYMYADMPEYLAEQKAEAIEETMHD